MKPRSNRNAASAQQTVDAPGRRLLDEMLDRPPAAPAAERAAVVVGTIVATEPEPCVTWDDQPQPTPARSTVPLGAAHRGRQVTLLFEAGDPARPIVTGVLQLRPAAEQPALGIEVDDDVLRLEGRRQVVLRCGEASITLTRAGKVIVKGAYVSSRSTGIHRILGGSVEIN